MKEKKEFFISYTKADETWAKWIAAVLEADGYGCTVQAWDFKPGGNFVLDMHEALLHSNRVIAVLSPEYLTSLYCQAEWTAAFTRDPNSERRLLIPVRVADVEPEGLLAAIIYIDLFGADEAAARQSLLAGVDIRNNPRNQPSFPGSRKVRFPGSLPFNNLPYIRNEYFTGRGDVLAALRNGFSAGAAAQAITGLGGIGKTQTALEYAYRYAEQYDWIWWVPAETGDTVMKAYHAFALKLHLIDEDQQNHALLAETVLNWMDTHEKWLFLYDNLDSVPGDTAWWPRNNRGHILITTRNRQLSVSRECNLSVFTQAEAADFLQKRTGIGQDSQNAALLAGRLGCLPLALEQAAAYIKNAISFPDYLQLLDQYGLRVLEETDGIVDYAKPVTATWEISLNKIGMESAGQLLYLCAYMASEDLDSGYFRENAGLLPKPLGDQLADGLASVMVWKELTRYSLLHRQGNTMRYAMHRLLQEVVRSKLGTDATWIQCCLTLFEETFQFDYGNIPAQNRFLRLLPHVEAFIDCYTALYTNPIWQRRLIWLLDEGGWGQLHLGNYAQALTWYHKALYIREKVLPPDHPDLAATYNNLAAVYENQNQLQKALTYYQKALAISEKTLGADHPDTASVYNNLAMVYHAQGDLQMALQWYQKALAICEKQLGRSHPHTAATYHNIAAVYASLNEPDKAIAGYQDALAIREKVLGDGHPDTASTYDNLAMVYFSQGNPVKALELLQRALAVRGNVLGLDHLDTAATCNHLAHVLAELGEPDAALRWFQTAYDTLLKTLGEDHPYTMDAAKSIRELS